MNRYGSPVRGTKAWRARVRLPGPFGVLVDQYQLWACQKVQAWFGLP